MSCAVYEQSLLDGLQGSEAGAGAENAGAFGSSGSSGALVVAGGAGAPSLGGSGGSSGELDDESGSAGEGGNTNASGGTAGALVGLGGSAGSVAGDSSGGSGGTVAGSPGVGGSAGSAAGSAGADGGAGAPGTPLCSAYPLTPRTSWTPSASHQSTTPKNPPSALTDGLSARWSSGKPQSGDEWLQIDFGTTVSLRGVNLQQGPDTNDYPRSYAVIVSGTAKDLGGTVRASGLGTPGASTNIALSKPVSGRYLLVKQTGSSLSWWSVAEVEVSCAD